MIGLKGNLVRHVPSNDGIQAVLELVEPNGDLHTVRCLCKANGTTEIGEVGNGETLGYLNHRYGDQIVCRLAREITLGYSERKL